MSTDGDGVGSYPVTKKKKRKEKSAYTEMSSGSLNPLTLNQRYGYIFICKDPHLYSVVENRVSKHGLQFGRLAVLLYCHYNSLSVLVLFAMVLLCQLLGLFRSLFAYSMLAAYHKMLSNAVILKVHVFILLLVSLHYLVYYLLEMLLLVLCQLPKSV